MKQLGGMDASFLYMETPQTPMHVAGLSIVERSTRASCVSKPVLT